MFFDRNTRLKQCLRRRCGRIFGLALVVAASVAVVGPRGAWAGVFDLPRFVLPGNFAIGFEAEVPIQDGAGIGANFRYRHGLNDLLNVYGVLGTGTGPRQFRAGGGAVFDFFPDFEGQPGIGVAAQGVYYRLRGDIGFLELTVAPYIHKSFATGGGWEVEPYFAFPFGLGFMSDEWSGVGTAALGGIFRNDTRLNYVFEIGIAVNNTPTYFSGGISYHY